jgi:DNA-binding transcriptional ArsR family regulator
MTDLHGSTAGPREDDLDLVFGALSDPTRRQMLRTLIAEGTTSAPRLSAGLPISRQAIAKHLTTLDQAGLIERKPGAGREVTYRLRPEALQPAADWIDQADRAWATRLDRLKRAVESRATRAGGTSAAPGA